MKRKRKVWYEIRVKDMWWGGKNIGWIKSEDLSNTNYKSVCSSRTLRTAQKAFSCMANLPSRSVLTRWYYKKGIRYCQDFIKN